MVAANWHTFQVLTKRSERMRDLLASDLKCASVHKHIWWGVSVEDRKHELPRIEHLQQSEAAVRFLSIEPLLEDLGVLDLSKIDWVIAGGESGHGARSMKKDWVVSIQRQCNQNDVAFFFKQWGMWGPDGQRRSKSANGRLLDGKTWDQLPEPHVS
jgi:protein gp37